MGSFRWISAGLACVLVVVPAFAQRPSKGHFPPPTGTWQRTVNSPPVGMGCPFLLTDGTVLVHRPNQATWYKLTPDASGSYVNGTWSQMASMVGGHAPLYYGSAVLADGRVVVVGGEYNGNQGGVWSNKCSLYNPITNVWSTLSPPSGWDNIGDAQCAVLPNGKFVLAMPFDTRMAILNPTSMAWSPLQGSGKGDRFDEEGWTLLRDGNILTCDAINAPHAEKYIISQDQWISAGNTPQSLEDPGSQELGPMVMRPDGTIFAMGATGHNAVYTPGQFPTDPGTWTAAPDFPNQGGQLDIADGPACLLPNGKVLCQASPGVFNTPSVFFEFDGTNLTQVPSVPNAPNIPSYVGNMLVLPTGQILFTDFSQDVEIYTPAGGPDPSWAPTITFSPTTLAPGMSFILQGRQLNGLSQACAYGDDASNATNYPLVRLTNIATGHVQYCRTHDHSTMAVATGALIVATRVDVPANAEAGASRLEVVTNGIPSTVLNVTIANKIVTGHVTLQDWAASSLYAPVTVELRTPGSTTPMDSQTVLLDQNGNFQIATSLPTGSYDVTVKGSHWLRGVSANQTLTAGGLSGLSLALRNGDINGDNAVTLADFTILRSQFGAQTNGPADLNGDGSVTVADFTILNANFGANGAP